MFDVSATSYNPWRLKPLEKVTEGGHEHSGWEAAPLSLVPGKVAFWFRQRGQLPPPTDSVPRPDRPLFSHLLQQQSFAFNGSSFLHIITRIFWLWTVSSLSEREPLSSCAVRAARGGGFSFLGAQAVGAWDSAAVMHGSSFSEARGDLPRSGIAPVCPALQGEF